MLQTKPTCASSYSSSSWPVWVIEIDVNDDFADEIKLELAKIRGDRNILAQNVTNKAYVCCFIFLVKLASVRQISIWVNVEINWIQLNSILHIPTGWIGQCESKFLWCILYVPHCKDFWCRWFCRWNQLQLITALDCYWPTNCGTILQTKHTRFGGSDLQQYLQQ